VTDLPPSNPNEKVLNFGETTGLADVPIQRVQIQEHILLGEHTLRTRIALFVLAAFIATNGAILFGLYLALEMDLAMARVGNSTHIRFIDQVVIGSLLAATTTQLGAIIFVIARYLFPNSRPSST